jgi:hypothetical protein
MLASEYLMEVHKELTPVGVVHPENSQKSNPGPASTPVDHVVSQTEPLYTTQSPLF